MRADPHLGRPPRAPHRAFPRRQQLPALALQARHLLHRAVQDPLRRQGWLI